jgi:ribosomal protein S18 acetylase RimI-like enzyme
MSELDRIVAFEQAIQNRSATRTVPSERQLVEAMRLKVATARPRFFAAEEDGVVASHCSLYSDGEIGQIESVLTLPFFRGRGLARAVVLHALAESRAAGHELTFLVAEEDDWPKELYGKLGFETIGRHYEFSCPPAPGDQERTRPASPAA